MVMLSCGSLVWIDTGNGVAAVSPSLRFGGVSQLIFLFFVLLLEEWLLLFIHKELFNIKDISEKVSALRT